MTHDEAVAELPSVLRGELDRAALHDVIEHLRGCTECSAELVDLAGGNAALLAASRTLREDQPVPQAEAPETLPALRPARGRRRLLTRTAIGVAAAAALVIAVTVGITVGRDQEATRAAQLSAVAGSTGQGTVTMAASADDGTRMTLTTKGLRPAGDGKFYYAWLFDPATNKMLALGVVGPDGNATFTVDSSILSRYHAVDVSLQDDNGNPAHSALSVLRGRY
ncbi:MAG TPA: anti-sigma factor [Dermatophilaceae bacterium]|nr:anti-sigma factor [Dermatophilaceae bacterium]